MIEEDKALIFFNIEDGIHKVKLDIKALYPEEHKRCEFKQRLNDFSKADEYSPDVFNRTEDSITYQSECIIPTKSDKRPPLLLLVGNPASHSIYHKMFFAYEGEMKEHGFWIGLQKSRLFSFSDIFNLERIEETNRLRKKELFNLSYRTEFKVGLAVFYTMPSPASGYPWSGVLGLKRLFRKKVFDRITKIEKKRIEKIINEFAGFNGSVIVTQKDAYQAIKSARSPDYDEKNVLSGVVKYECECNPAILLYCLPKSYLFKTTKVIQLLSDVRSKILNK